MLNRREGLRTRYFEVRSATDQLTTPLGPEDQTVQSMADVSPTKWHRAHTSWFFETFVLLPFQPNYCVFDEGYDYLFNSYYESVGPRYPRDRRGLISRPGLSDISAYRKHVDAAMDQFLAADPPPEAADLVELGLHHEEQHQELILMDIQHVLWNSPLQPAYSAETHLAPSPTSCGIQPQWHDLDGGVVTVGHNELGFGFDNEGPGHQILLAPYRIAERLVTNAQWINFINDGGYSRPELWLADGWAAVKNLGWQSPLYWEHHNECWTEFSLRGREVIDPSVPVHHISHYEADAFARWSNSRLPTEFEWEHAVRQLRGDSLRGSSASTASTEEHASQPLNDSEGHVWQWTASAYLPYPGFQPAIGAVGEYNGKFMSGQMVLRGSSCFTPTGHSRVTYRNFFPPAARWVAAGLRLASDT